MAANTSLSLVLQLAASRQVDWEYILPTTLLTIYSTTYMTLHFVCSLNNVLAPFHLPVLNASLFSHLLQDLCSLPALQTSLMLRSWRWLGCLRVFRGGGLLAYRRRTHRRHQQRRPGVAEASCGTGLL